MRTALERACNIDDLRRLASRRLPRPIFGYTIVVSNHGGRQLDGAPAPLDVLPEIASRVAGRAEIILDGGIRRGTDVLKALGLGAHACMIGRPYLYGLGAGGQAGGGASTPLTEVRTGPRNAAPIGPTRTPPSSKEGCGSRADCRSGCYARDLNRAKTLREYQQECIRKSVMMKKRREVGSDLAENRRGIQSVEVGIPLLKALQRAPGPLTLTALSESASMPASKAHRYLSSYVRAGLVRQDPRSREYELGPAALSLGLAALSQLDLVSLAGEAARTVAESTGHTTLMSVWSERGAVIVRWIRGLQPVVTSLALGSALPALSSATGQVFLANLPRTATTEAVRLEQRARHRMKNASLSELQIDELISRVRRQRASWVDSGYIPGLRAFACPILDYQGEAAAALTLISATEHLADPKHPAAQALVEACEKVNQQAGSFVLSGPRRH